MNNTRHLLLEHLFLGKLKIRLSADLNSTEKFLPNLHLPTDLLCWTCLHMTKKGRNKISGAFFLGHYLYHEETILTTSAKSNYFSKDFTSQNLHHIGGYSFNMKIQGTTKGSEKKPGSEKKGVAPLWAPFMTSLHGMHELPSLGQYIYSWTQFTRCEKQESIIHGNLISMKDQNTYWRKAFS